VWLANFDGTNVVPSKKASGDIDPSFTSSAEVAGGYSSDPQKNKQATLYRKLTYDRAIKENLQVMDLAAFNICRAAEIPICVYDFTQHQLTDVIAGKTPGTIISGGRDD